jgi:hypothetical protein
MSKKGPHRHRARFRQGGINWDWFTEVEFHIPSRTCRILAHYRIHRYDSPVNPTCVTTETGFKMVEGDGRIVCAVQFNRETWPVMNPGYIFGLPDQSVMPMHEAEMVVVD